MNLALAQYNQGNETNIEEIEHSVVVVKNQLDLLHRIFHTFNSHLYYHGTPIEQLQTLNKAAEFVQQTKELETRFMNIIKRLKLAFDICSVVNLFLKPRKMKFIFIWRCVLLFTSSPKEPPPMLLK